MKELKTYRSKRHHYGDQLLLLFPRLLLRGLSVLVIMSLSIADAAPAVPAWSEDYPANGDDGKLIRLVFYNLENLFDTYDDTLKLDDEFLPEGERHWSPYRYRAKLINLYKTIAAMGEDVMPAMIGFCEIENEKVINDLLYDTPLKKLDYGYVHFDSPDRRGIDVALIYRKDMFTTVSSSGLTVVLPGDNAFTRDILYVRGTIKGYDRPLHVFVNHWPSRRGGQAASEVRRIIASRTLLASIDSMELTSDDAIVIMGDFNDQPYNKSLALLSGSSKTFSSRLAGNINNASGLQDMNAFINNAASWKGDIASYKYRGEWYLFDQFISSAILNRRDSQLRLKEGSFRVFHPSFLLQDDKTYLGKKPFSTYSAYKYSGGFSDHLPVIIDLVILK